MSLPASEFPPPSTMNSIAAALPHTGVWPAMLTPLQADGSIDMTRLAGHARRLLGAGCAGVTLFGTTGEGPSFSVAERMQALQALIDHGVPARQILVHTSCAALPETVALTRHASSLGVHACLLLPPFFFKGVSDNGVLDAYRSVLDSCREESPRVVLYHIPQVSGVGLSHAVITALLRAYPGQILGLKDSGCDLDASLAYAQAFMPPMQVWVGNEMDVPALAAQGTMGTVSGVANMLPLLVGRLLVTGRDPKAVATDLERMGQFLDLVGGYTMISAFKGIMAIIDRDPTWLPVRAPLRTLSVEEFEHLREQWLAFQPGGGQG